MTRRIAIAARRSPGALLAELRRRNPILYGTALLNAALFVAFAAGVAVDPQTIGGDPRWLKPAKFAGAIALFTATLGWLSDHLPTPNSTVRRASIGVAAASVLEIALIAGQAGRGVESHFNDATALDVTVYAIMGITINLMMLLVAWLLVRSWRREFDVAPAFAWGIRLGLLLFVVGALEGAAMVALGAHAVGSATEIPAVGWQLSGDFRPAHFVGLHGLQVLPLAGYLASVGANCGRLDNPVRAVVLVGAAHAAILVAALALAVVPFVV